MSTFCGQIAEIPAINIDRFDRFDADAYFLSHCHEDHMYGLRSPQFQNVLLASDTFLYLSHVSAVIIQRTFPRITSQLKELDFNYPTKISTKNDTFYVTILPAGHCPGSVMFLFEDQHVLYTGDYRLGYLNDLTNMKGFYDSFNKPKRIDKIYLDTTFFLRDYARFPSRNESLQKTCAIIKEWIGKGPKHTIKLITSAKYGYEYLLIEIYKQLQLPVHVSDETYTFYSRIPELDRTVTKSSDATAIHLACGSHYKCICRNSIEFPVKKIKLSAMRWQNDDFKLHGGGCDVDDAKEGIHFVCYSTHASYEEGLELIRFLKPKEIEPNVVPTNDILRYEMNGLIDEVLRDLNDTETAIRKRPKLFQVQALSVSEDTVMLKKPRTELDELLDSVLDSP